MIFDEHETTTVKIIFCPKCRKFYWAKNDGRYSCLVVHSPGSCCHFGDFEISEELVGKVEYILEKEIKRSI